MNNTDKNLIGMRFGRLVVVEKLPRRRSDTGRLIPQEWRCKCDCGEEKIAQSGPLVYGKIKSCGCMQKEMYAKGNTHHSLDDRRPCPFPIASCDYSRRGRCCFDCDEAENCENICLNTPDKCGRFSEGGAEIE